MTCALVNLDCTYNARLRIFSSENLHLDRDSATTDAVVDYLVHLFIIHSFLEAGRKLTNYLVHHADLSRNQMKSCLR